MVKGLIALFVCVSVNLNVHATNYFLTWPDKVLVYCEHLDIGLKESELELFDVLSKKGFTCKNIKSKVDTEIVVCQDKDENILIAGFAKDKTSCLNDFRKFTELFEKFKKTLPKID